MTTEYIGRPVSRVDGRQKVTGRATYAAEFDIANQAHAAVVRSTIANGCKRCATLTRYLRASDRVRFEWPLAQTQRAHIHDILDSRELPVRHTTRHTGRPFTLMLERPPPYSSAMQPIVDHGRTTCRGSKGQAGISEKGTWLGRLCILCSRIRPNEAFGGKGERESPV